MSNHYHLVITETEGALPDFMASLNHKDVPWLSVDAECVRLAYPLRKWRRVVRR
jgi:hypothetical protein